jgi:hypothetical protein
MKEFIALFIIVSITLLYLSGLIASVIKEKILAAIIYLVGASTLIVLLIIVIIDMIGGKL